VRLKCEHGVTAKSTDYKISQFLRRLPSNIGLEPLSSYQFDRYDILNLAAVGFRDNVGLRTRALDGLVRYKLLVFPNS
jgi:hypothetical protein